MTVRVMVSLQDKSGLAKDQYVNTLYYEPVLGNPDLNVDVTVKVKAFYYAIAQYFSPCIATDGHTIKLYAVGAPLDTPPFYTTEFAIPPTSGAPLPNEVASCLSFKGAFHAGWNKQSTRGRIYLGPLNTTSTASIANESGIPGQGFVDAVMAAGALMYGGMKTASGPWVIYSKLHLASTPITELSMNNEWDTQRSRGKVATVRTAQIVTP
jgi:hypothetical protein